MSRANILLLRLESLLEKELGKYKYENGDLKPAIKIVPPQVAGVNLEVPGVECLIYDKPKFKTPELLCETVGTSQYHVALFQHKLDSTLENSQLLISKIFSVDWQEKLQETKEVRQQYETEYQIELETANILIDEEKVDFDDPVLLSTITQLVTAFYA